MTYALIYYISWPIIIYLGYKLSFWAVKKYEAKYGNS